MDLRQIVREAHPRSNPGFYSSSHSKNSAKWIKRHPRLANKYTKDYYNNTLKKNGLRYNRYLFYKNLYHKMLYYKHRGLPIRQHGFYKKKYYGPKRFKTMIATYEKSWMKPKSNRGAPRRIVFK